jgi:hypothetical protein
LEVEVDLDGFEDVDIPAPYAWIGGWVKGCGCEELGFG